MTLVWRLRSAEFTLDKPDNVQISVFDITGSLVDVLVDEYLTVGKHQVTWGTSDIPSGCYYYSIRTTKSVVVKKAIKR